MRFGALSSLLAAILGWGCLASRIEGVDSPSGGGGSSTGVGGIGSGGISAGNIGGATSGGGPAGVTLTVDPNPIDFGFDPLCLTAVACATVTNPGDVAVTITGAGDFTSKAFALSPVDGSTPPNPAPVPVTIEGGASATAIRN